LLFCFVFPSLSLRSDGPWNRYEPEAYKNAYRRIVDVLRTSGVKNFATVWQSATSSFGTFGNRSIWDWWPGDAYVDWAGLSYFVPHAPSLDALLGAARFKGVPVLICESAPLGCDLARRTVASTPNGTQDNRAASVDDTWGKWFVPLLAFIRDTMPIFAALAMYALVCVLFV
jgi:Glycosyl hydrolase family 26